MAEAANHTPGPWAQDESDDMEIIADVGAVICRVYTAVDFPCVEDSDAAAVELQAQANARLIAAAPVLLAALTALAAEAHRNMVGGAGHLIDDAHSAIMLATGETSFSGYFAARALTPRVQA